MWKKISNLYKIGHFSLNKFYTSQVSQKALFIHLKFYSRNRKFITGQVNWFIKLAVKVEVIFFFLTTTVSVTDQLWLISWRKFLSTLLAAFFKLSFPTQRHSTRLWYIKSDKFFKISVIWFLFKKTITDKIFWSELILVG